jgi:hypothetical protein
MKLQTVHDHLSSHTPVAAHHVDARSSVSEAIRELNTALGVK